MKKILSIMLATMMLVSLFAVNASALISPTYTEVVGREIYLEQDFSDAEKLDFGAGTYGKTTVENGCVTLHSPTDQVLHVSSPTAIPENATKWTIEFDVRRNSDFAEDSYYGLFFTCHKSSYKGVQEKIDNYIENYGIYIPVMQLEKDTWYTYRVNFDEDAVVAQVPNVTSNIPNTLARYIVTKAEYKKAGDENWTVINDEKSWNSVHGQARSLVRNQSNGYVFKGYPVEVDGEKVNTTNEMSFIFRVPSSVTATEDDIKNANFSLDNIKAYVPGEELVKNYPLTNGNIYLSSKTVNVPDASQYADANMFTNNAFTTASTVPVAGETKYYTLSFDAKNTVQGMPITIHVAGASCATGLTICPTDIIGTDWYSYKVAYYEKDGVLNFWKVLRKPTDSNEPYSVIPVTSKYLYQPGDQLWAYGTPSSAKNDIRILYYTKVMGAAVEGATLTDTVWEMKNIQVTDLTYVQGFVNAENGEISVDANLYAGTEDALVALAVYGEGGRMSDVNFVKAVNTEDEVNLIADYADGNTATLLIWDAAMNNAPMVQPINVVSALAK